MNARTVPPEPPRDPQPPQTSERRRPPAITGRDREFLPAALELLETPPAPLPVALMMTICAFVFAALVWSFIGRLDVHAAAPGKIETAGHAKVIEPMDPGRIAAIHVENGSRVKAGDLLLELDPAETIADETAARGTLNAGIAEVARRRFAIETIRAVQRAPVPSPDDTSALVTAAAPFERQADDAETRIAWGEPVPVMVRVREAAVLRADLAQLSDALTSLDRQMAQKRATRERLAMSIGFEDTLIETLTQRVGTRQEAIAQMIGTKINLYDAKEELEKSQSTLASDQGQLIETSAALRELQSEKAKALSQFIADNENKLSDAARKVDEGRQALAKAAARLSHTRLVAPIDGVVQQMAVTTVGQVVASGQQLLVLTPNGGRLQVEALVANLDIGFVRLGQEAAVKVDAFPFTRFGILHGKVVAITTQAIDEQEAKRALANATAAANGGGGTPTSAPGQPDSYVFPVIVALDETAMKVGDATIPMTAGMTVSVEIRTDSRRVIDYLLSPLSKIASEAMREP